MAVSEEAASSGNTLKTLENHRHALVRGTLAVVVGLIILMPAFCALPNAKSGDIDDWTRTLLKGEAGWLFDAKSVVDSRGVVHVVSDNSSQYGLDYQTNEGGVWMSEFIPAPVILGAEEPRVHFVSIAVDASSKAHIAFTVWFDGLSFYGGSLIYATNAGGSWSTEFVDEGTDTECYRGDRPWIVINPDGNPQIFYLGSSEADCYEENLWHATKIGSAWEIVEVRPSIVLWYDSLSYAMDPSGVSHVAGSVYNAHTDSRDLVYYSDSGGAWKRSTVIAGGVGNTTSICLDPQGRPHIGVNRDVFNEANSMWTGNFIHSWLANGSWYCETVYTQYLSLAFEVGEDSSLASDSFGNIHVIYRGLHYKEIYSTNEGGEWSSTFLGPLVSYYSTPETNSIAVDKCNTVHAVFCEGGSHNALYYAFRETLCPFPVPTQLVMSEIECPLVWVGQTVTVIVYDQFGEVYPNYTGTVHFSSNCTDEVSLPEDYQFQASDQGQHTFHGEVLFLSEGWYTLECVDTTDADLAVSQSGIHAVVEPPTADSIVLCLPSLCEIGTPLNMTVTVLDQYSAPFEDYVGTIRFASSDPEAVLPEDYTFTVADAGVHEFTDEITLHTIGTQTITTTDVLDPAVSGTGETYVAVCEYTSLTIPFNESVDFCMFKSEMGVAYHICSNVTPGYETQYEFMGLSLYTYEVSSSGGICIRGYFRFSDALLPYWQGNERKLFAYVMDDNTSTILQKAQVLDYTFPMNVWHWRQMTLNGYSPGEIVRIGFGRYQAYVPAMNPPTKLIAEWAGVEVIRPEDLPPAPPTVAPLADVSTPCCKETTFRALAWDDNGGPLLYTWDFGDGTPLAVGNPINHVYDSIGAFNFTVYVDDCTGFSVSSSAVATVTVGEGTLRVVLDPVVPGMVYVNGAWTTRWGIECLMLPAGDYELSFGRVVGYMPPLSEMITIKSGEVTMITAEYVEMATLRVITSPALPSTIYVDGIGRNDWGLWVYVPSGTYEVSFGKVSDHISPLPMTVTLAPGEHSEVIGEFSSSPGAPGEQSSYGLLRVWTDPALPTTIYLDGIWRTQYGIDWLKLAPGTYRLSYTVLPFYGGSGLDGNYSQDVTIVEGQVCSYQIPSSTLKANPILILSTDPPVPTTIFVDGIARSSWGLSVDVPVSTTFSCYASVSHVAGFETPPPYFVYVWPEGICEYVFVFDSIW